MIVLYVCRRVAVTFIMTLCSGERALVYIAQRACVHGKGWADCYLEYFSVRTASIYAYHIIAVRRQELLTGKDATRIYMHTSSSTMGVHTRTNRSPF